MLEHRLGLTGILGWEEGWKINSKSKPDGCSKLADFMGSFTRGGTLWLQAILGVKGWFGMSKPRNGILGRGCREIDPIQGGI